MGGELENSLPIVSVRNFIQLIMDTDPRKPDSNEVANEPGG